MEIKKIFIRDCQIMDIEKIFIRDFQRCDSCGKTICSENAYRLHLYTNYIDVCSDCLPKTRNTNVD